MAACPLSIEALSALFAAHPIIWWLLSAVVGACMASFVGVVAERLPRRVGVVLGPDGPTVAPPDRTVSLLEPSRCVCGDTLRMRHMVPVLGWLWFRGRHHCGARVPLRYPLVEGGCALVSALVAWRLGPTLPGLLALVVLWSGLCIAWMDLTTQWIADRISIPLVLLGLCASPFDPDPSSRILGMTVALGLMAASLAWVAWREAADGIPSGDVVLAAMGGAWVGMAGVPEFLLLSALYFGIHTLPLRIRTLLLVENELRRIRLAGLGTLADAGSRAVEAEPAGAPMAPSVCLALLTCLLLPYRPEVLLLTWP